MRHRWGSDSMTHYQEPIIILYVINMIKIARLRWNEEKEQN